MNISSLKSLKNQSLNFLCLNRVGKKALVYSALFIQNNHDFDFQQSSFVFLNSQLKSRLFVCSLEFQQILSGNFYFCESDCFVVETFVFAARLRLFGAEITDPISHSAFTERSNPNMIFFISFFTNLRVQS